MVVAVVMLTLFLALAPSVYGAVNILAVLLLLLGLFVGWRDLHHFQRPVRIIWLFFGLYVGVALLSLINNANWSHAAWRFERFYPFLLFIPLFGVLWRSNRWLFQALMVGVVGGAMAMAIVCLNDFFIHEQVRAGFSTGINVNTLGHLAYVYAAICLAALITVPMRLRWQIIIGCGVLAAIFTGIATGSRGALLAFLAMLIFLVLLLLGSHWFSKKAKIAVLVASAVIAVAILIYIDHNRFWLSHLQRIEIEVGAFISGDFSRSSIGLRLLMWLAAIKILQANPFIGTGIGDQRDDLVALQLSGEIPSMGPAAYSTFHNFYFDALAMTGLLGFTVMLLAIFILPGRLFWRTWFVAKDHEDYDRFYPLAGLLMLVVSAFYGLTASWLYLRGLPIIIVLIMVLIVGCNRTLRIK